MLLKLAEGRGTWNDVSHRFSQRFRPRNPQQCRDRWHLLNSPKAEGDQSSCTLSDLFPLFVSQGTKWADIVTTLKDNGIVTTSAHARNKMNNWFRKFEDLVDKLDKIRQEHSIP